MQVTPPRRPAPRKPSHRGRNAWIGVIGVFVILAAVGSATSRPLSVTGPTPPPGASEDAGVPDDTDNPDALPTTPPGAALLTLKGTGPQTSDPFTASGASVGVSYDYTCPTEDSFTLNFYGTNSSPLLPDELASDYGATGTNAVTEQLNGQTGPFTVEVDTACTWSIEVMGEP